MSSTGAPAQSQIVCGEDERRSEWVLPLAAKRKINENLIPQRIEDIMSTGEDWQKGGSLYAPSFFVSSRKAGESI